MSTTTPLNLLSAALLLSLLLSPTLAAGKTPRRAPGAATQPAGAADARRISSISLERTMCLGSCPAYVVTLHRDGRAIYVGKNYAPRLGTYVAKVWPATFDRLARLVLQQGFFTLRPSYRARITCQSSAILRVVRAGKQVQVLDYGRAGPVALWGLRQAVDNVAHGLEWRRRLAKGKRPKKPLAPQQLVKTLQLRLTTWRQKLPGNLPPLAKDSGLASWAWRDARRACAHHPHGGTLFMELDKSATARIVSAEVTDVATASERLTSSKQSPLRQRQFHRIGLSAAWDEVEQRYCVVAYFGR